MPEFIKCEQNTPEWHAARCGIATASMFGVIVKQDGTASTGKQRTTYMMELAGELITGEPVQEFYSAATARGHKMEPDAASKYSFITGNEPTPGGFIRNGSLGYSPDSLIGDVGALEIKSKQPKFAVECIVKDEFPPEHKAQCQGGLLVSERDWIDIAVYWPGLPLFIKRAGRDEAYLKNLSASLEAFNEELAEVVEKVRAYGVAA